MLKIQDICQLISGLLLYSQEIYAFVICNDQTIRDSAWFTPGKKYLPAQYQIPLKVDASCSFLSRIQVNVYLTVLTTYTTNHENQREKLTLK